MNFLNQFLKSINPQQLVMQMMQYNNSPELANLVELAKAGNTKELENIAKKVCGNNGGNFDNAFALFMKNFK